jgi:hypothetical protein
MNTFHLHHWFYDVSFGRNRVGETDELGVLHTYKKHIINIAMTDDSLGFPPYLNNNPIVVMIPLLP